MWSFSQSGDESMSFTPTATSKSDNISSLRKYPIDGQVFKKLIEAGLLWLRTNQQSVNALNVFPVPDGDTGTNMVLTMQAAYDEIVDSPDHNIGKLTQSVAHGALMGARGNSGVILSQLWRGFAHALDEQETLDGPSLAKAFHLGRNTAYKGVVRPVEGTILTVAKDIDIAAQQVLSETDDPYEILEKIIPAADKSVEYTPELLDVLKEAGVVDAGGKGLFFIFEGMTRYFNGQALDTPESSVQPLSMMQLENTLVSIEPGQDFEVVVDFRPNEQLDLIKFYDDLEEMGTSIQVGEGEGIFRMHIHVPEHNRYKPIDYAMTLGTITKVAMENLIAQMEELEQVDNVSLLNLAPVESGQIAVIAVVPGMGIGRVFASLGVAAIVEGGQTMNPSTQDIMNSFENLPTEKIIILPNNKNIIMAAKSAAELNVKNVVVIPSHSVPQGLSAMLRLAPDGNLDQIADEMISAIDEVETCEITTATRNVEIDGISVQEGQIIGLLNGKLVEATDNLDDTCLGMLREAHADHFEIITIFYGVNISKKEVNKVVDDIRKAYPGQEIEVQEGGQPHYQFIIAIE
jgi:DAK2 domain fusion protein YloV